jgi:hypothetical protein
MVGAVVGTGLVVVGPVVVTPVDVVVAVVGTVNPGGRVGGVDVTNDVVVPDVVVLVGPVETVAVVAEVGVVYVVTVGGDVWPQHGVTDGSGG